ncbi:hypothetical protein KKE60_07525 [Patescibacteria group bacterium]|nr:hypothetical protein [Patescibacteria group bacterium]
MKNMPIHNFDWLMVRRIPRHEFRSDPTFDHWGDYFKSEKGGITKVIFKGSGHVDIFLGESDDWPTATSVVDETITRDKIYEFEVLPGYTFEPRVYKGSEITSIEIYGPLALLEVVSPLIAGTLLTIWGLT